MPENRRPNDLEDFVRQAHFDARMDELVRLIKSGFPEDDPVAHRRVHEGFIKRAADRAELAKSIRDKSITGIVLSLGSFALLAIWEYFKSQVHK